MPKLNYGNSGTSGNFGNFGNAEILLWKSF